MSFLIDVNNVPFIWKGIPQVQLGERYILMAVEQIR